MSRRTYAALLDQVKAALVRRRKDNPPVDRECPDLAVVVVLEALAVWYADAVDESEAEAWAWVSACAQRRDVAANTNPPR